MNRILWKKGPLVVVIVIGLLLILAVSVSSASPITFKDGHGRDIVLEKPAERIAFTSYTVAEAIKLSGAWNKVVARDGYISDSLFYPNLDAIPAISAPDAKSAYDFDIEKVVEINPDVLILPVDIWLSNTEKTEQIINSLEPEIPVIFLTFADPNSFADNFQTLSEITGTKEYASNYLNYYNNFLDDIKAKTSLMHESDKPVVFIKAAAFSPDQLMTWGNKEEKWNNLCDITGVRSASRSIDGAWIMDVDPEWLVQTGSDFDAIIVQCWDYYYPETFGYSATEPSNKKENAGKIIQKISGMDVFSNTPAVTNGNIYLLHDPLFSTPRFILSIAYMAKWFHPDLFPDLNPEQVHRDYLRYIGADYDLNSVGLAAYP